MNFDLFRRQMVKPGPVLAVLAGLLGILMLVHLARVPSAPDNRVEFLAPSSIALPEAYATGMSAPGHAASTHYSPDGLTLLPKTHWFARETLFQQLPDGLADDAALNAWRAAQRDPSRYGANAFQGDCSGQCLPETLVPPNPGEDLAVTTRDCLSQEQAARLDQAWSIWPVAAGLRVGPTLRIVVASFSMSSGTCPVARWSVRVTDRPYPRPDED